MRLDHALSAPAIALRSGLAAIIGSHLLDVCTLQSEVAFLQIRAQLMHRRLACGLR